MNPRTTAPVQAVDWLTSLHYRSKPRRDLSEDMRRQLQRGRRISGRWGWRENIVGFGVARKHVRGNVSDAACVTFFVRRKQPRHRLPEAERIPEWLEFEGVDGKVLTDLVVLNSSPVAHADDELVRPVRPGTPVGHERGILGTLGLIVTSDLVGGPLGLGCSHVLARSGTGAAEGDIIEQPYNADLLDPTVNGCGKLTKYFTRLSGNGALNSSDVALVSIDPPGGDPAQIDTGTIVQDWSKEQAQGFTPGTNTLLNGVKTKGASGRILAFQATWTIDEMPFVAGPLQFTGLVAYRTNCQKGDSGAAVLEEGTATALGLHVGGSSADQLGLFEPLGPIFREYKLSLAKGTN